MYNYYRRNSGLNLDDFEVTKREIIASISIIAILLLIGTLISNKISEYQIDKNEKYNKAIKIESTELFQYGMNTNIGNAFVYGELKAVDTVTYPEIEGKYMYVEKVKEKYTMHTRQVAHTRKVGKTTQVYYTTETYWTWDRVGSESVKSKEVSFCGIVFSIKKFIIPDTEYITTVKKSSHIRYKYYGVKTNYTGTIFTELKGKTISNNTKFYKNMTIEETVDYLESNIGLIIFWIAWIILIIACVFGFYYFDNDWLD